MKTSICAFVATSLMTALAVSARAGDTEDQSSAKPVSAKSKSVPSHPKSEQNVPEVNLLEKK